MAARYLYILRWKIRDATAESCCTYSSRTVKSISLFSCISIYTEISLHLLYSIILWFVCVEESLRTFSCTKSQTIDYIRSTCVE